MPKPTWGMSSLLFCVRLVLTYSIALSGGVRQRRERAAGISGDPAAALQGPGGDDAAAAVGHHDGPRETDAQAGNGRRCGRRGSVSDGYTERHLRKRCGKRAFPLRVFHYFSSPVYLCRVL